MVGHGFHRAPPPNSQAQSVRNPAGAGSPARAYSAGSQSPEGVSIGPVGSVPLEDVAVRATFTRKEVVTTAGRPELRGARTRKVRRVGAEDGPAITAKAPRRVEVLVTTLRQAPPRRSCSRTGRAFAADPARTRTTPVTRIRVATGTLVGADAEIWLRRSTRTPSPGSSTSAPGACTAGTGVRSTRSPAAAPAAPVPAAS